MTKLTIEKYLKEKQYTFVALALFATLTFQLSASNGSFDAVFALISGLITQFMLISLNSREEREQTITLHTFRYLITLASITLPIWAIFRLPYFLNSLGYTIIFWLGLLIWAVVNLFIKDEL